LHLNKNKTLKMKKLSLLITLFSTILIFTACKKDPEEVVDEEVITTLRYTLTPDSGGTPVVLSFQDLDGDGGDAPIVMGGTLAANETYSGVMVLLNESESPAEDVTEEIEEDDDHHQFFFQSTLGGLSVSYDDEDGDGNPLGLKTNLSTGSAGSGQLTVTLRHEPNKSASGVADGNIENAGGETDIEVEFDIDVQ